MINPAFLVLGAANPGLLPLAFVDLSGGLSSGWGGLPYTEPFVPLRDRPPYTGAWPLSPAADDVIETALVVLAAAVLVSILAVGPILCAMSVLAR